MSLRALFLLLLGFGLVASLAVGITTGDDDDDDKDEKEQRVALKNVPDAVKATILTQLLRELDDLEIEEIVREKENGKTVYEIEIEADDIEIELEISANGKLLEKEVEREEEEDDDDDDDDE